MPRRTPVLLPAHRHRTPGENDCSWAVAVVGLAFGAYRLVPVVETMLNTISTDDAYVNGHVTFVAPRVSGQVSRVLVDDNYRVKKGALVVQLDKEPYQVQVAIKKAAVGAAEADLVAAEAQMRGLEAIGGSQRWQLQTAMEQVNNQVATLRANVATYQSKKATLVLAQANLKRGEELDPSGGISKEELDVRRQTVKVDEAAVEQALQQVYASRVYLGLPPQPANGHDLTEVPPDLEQTFSAVRTALYNLVQTTAQIGLNLVSENVTPRQFLADFRKRDASGDLDRILERTHPELAGRQAGQGQAPRGPRRPGSGPAEPPLLRRRQRDRRRGDPPQRQPRQQRPGGSEPDGGPLAHGDLDRCQLQGDSTGGPAHRPSGALRGGHVRQPP